MPVLTSEAVVLRTWPVREADLIVSFFTRDYGRMKGMAKSALKSRKRFGGALEPMTLARAWFAERPRQELVRLDQLEILRSPLSAPVDHARMAVLSFFAEVLDEALPEHDPQETVFRLLVSVLEQTTLEQPLDAAHLFFALDDAPHGPAARHRPLHRLRRGTAGGGGLLQQLRRRPVLRAASQRNGERLSADSWQLAQRMLRAPASAFAAEPGPAAADRTCAASPSRPSNATWSASCRGAGKALSTAKVFPGLSPTVHAQSRVLKSDL